MATIKVLRFKTSPTTHDTLLSANGKLYRPQVLGFLWKEKLWNPAGLRMSKGDGVLLFGGRLYRMQERVAKPLVIADNEFFRPADWHKGEAFVFEWTAAHSAGQN